MIAVSVNNITKNYGKVEALRGISFEVEQGEIFGVIGADGAGKTTLFRILATLVFMDKGTAVVDGCDVVNDYKTIRNRIGYMPGKFSLYQDLTVKENLDFFATIFHTSISENYHLIEDIYCQIEPFKNRRAGKLSGGMKQKLALSCALIHKPTVLLLDEPTTGVDPVSRKEFWGMLRKLKDQGITILVSTPYMDEAMLCDRIGLISHGNLLSVDTPENIIHRFGEIIWAVSAARLPKLLKDLRSMSVVKSSYAFGNSHHVTLKNKISIEEFSSELERMGNNDITVCEIQPTIEDCFIKLC